MPIAQARLSGKTDNNPQALKAKIDIRRRVLEQIAAPIVFDAFAGSGQMHAAVWRDALGYVGCDLKYARDGRTMFAADNRRVLRAIDLAEFNVFDLDAYGSPWEQAIIIADRRPVAADELIGIVLTQGAGLSYKANIVPVAIAELTGLRRGVVGLSKRQDDIIDRAIAGLARRMRCGVLRRWQAHGRTGASMRYIGLVLKGESRRASKS